MEYYPCDICKEIGECNCRYCELGNPCIGCGDYDEANDVCKSHGAYYPQPKSETSTSPSDDSMDR